ncbi:MAG: sodium/pantothenate symporter [Tepidanaerobacteraceae bacterium]|nr:sodium/pantothenate symporter [Tepidanaerobacteraceae bacterium]
MSMLLNIPYAFAILLVYLYILYTTFGGLFSVVKTDAVNAAIISAAFITFGIYLMQKCGGLSNIISTAAGIDTYPINGWDIKTPVGGLLHPFCKGLQPPVYVFTSFFGWGLGLAANPQYVIRIVSSRNRLTGKKMVIYSLMLLSTIYFFIVIGSIGLRTLIPSAPAVQNMDEIVPFLFNRIAPPYLTGFILIAIIASSVSTANSELLIIANSFTYDILKNKAKKAIGEDEMLSLNRITIAVAGTLSLLLSYNPPKNLIEFGGNMWGFFASSTFIPLYAGIFCKKASKFSAELSFFAGLIAYITLLSTQPMISNPLFKLIHPGLPSFIISLAAFIWGERKVKHAKH